MGGRGGEGRLEGVVPSARGQSGASVSSGSALELEPSLKMMLTTATTILLLAATAGSLLVLLLMNSRKRRLVREDLRPPGPSPWPVLGDLHILGRFPNPFVGFTALSKVYGNVYRLTLGATPCVVVNDFPLIKEVLITKGSHFGGRPDFIRFHKLFGGDRNNSLALCDWSSLQRTRRRIARMYCSPRFTSANYDQLSRVGCAETQHLMAAIASRLEGGHQEVCLKPLILAACANMFTQYMCSTRFNYDDRAFSQVVRNFDEIFWEINQGYAVDFLPWLLPFYKKHMRQLSDWATEIRQFIFSRIVEEHQKTMDYDAPPRDFTDALLQHLQQDPDLSWDHIIFELEDFLGGHSAIGNLAMLVLAATLRHPHVGTKIRQEVDTVTEGLRDVTLFDRIRMPYTEAVVLEVLRTASSPIVPHVATQDTSIGGYSVDKGTVVFLNNYELNLGDDYWSEPEEFKPERFISSEGSIIKPQHFIPFSTGKRTCIGQRLVQSFCFTLVATILGRYEISADMATVRTVPACVALPPDTFNLRFTPRQRH